MRRINVALAAAVVFIVAVLGLWAVDTVQNSVRRLEDKVESQIDVARVAIQKGDDDVTQLCETIEVGTPENCRTIEICTVREAGWTHEQWFNAHDANIEAAEKRWGAK